MLKILTYRDRLQIEDQLLNTDFEKSTWILSDLRSKLEIQNRLFARLGFSLDDFVLRASDLWRALLRKTEPEIEVIGFDYGVLVVKSFLSEVGKADESFRGLSEKVWLEQLNRWSLVVFSPELREQVQDYLEQESGAAWRREFALASLLATYFRSQKKILAQWIPGLLQNSLPVRKIWERPLIVDLRGELTQAEAELFRTLSRHVDVTILCPDSDFETDYFEISKPYEYLRTHSQSIEALGASSSMGETGSQTLLSFSGPLGEIKWAVAQIRRWLELGVDAEQIAIVAPDIESYWPCLQSYLQIEGIPVQKSVLSRLAAFPAVKQWLAVIRASLNPLDFFSHEKANFSEIDPIEIRYEEFRSYLFELYEPEDLQRLESIWKRTQSLSRWPEQVSRDEFLAKCMQLWPRGSKDFSEPIRLAIEKFLREAQLQTRASPQDWLKFFESLFVKAEVSILDKDDLGVNVTSVMSAWSQKLEKVIFLGMADENLKSFSRLGLSPVDSRALNTDLGVLIESVEQSAIEYEIRWWMRPSKMEIYFLQPATDWAGQLLNHSPLFLQMPLATADSGANRWDRLQAQSLDSILTDGKARQRLREDLGEAEAQPVHVPAPSRLSPSAVESYLKCKFILLAQKWFHLLDKADLDIDIDPRKSGEFHHAFAESLLKSAINFELSETQIGLLAEEMKLRYFHFREGDPTWPPRRNKLVRWGQQFLKNEKSWAAEFPQNQILKTEVDWKMTFENINFSGRIDRIDGNSDLNHWILMDYKSSGAGLTSPQKWLSKGKLQMLFYLWAVERGAVDGIRGQSLGAFYYNFKTFERGQGLRLDVESPLLPKSRKSPSTINPEEYQNLLAEFEIILSDVIKNLNSGRYEAKPLDEKDCPSCPWNRTCRAHHLNQI